MPPFRYLSAALGVITLVSLLLGEFLVNGGGNLGPVASLGGGGIERWIAYPVVLWLVGFGGYLLGGPTRDTSRTP